MNVYLNKLSMTRNKKYDEWVAQYDKKTQCERKRIVFAMMIAKENCFIVLWYSLHYIFSAENVLLKLYSFSHE